MNLHLVGGWAYPASACKELAASLSGIGDITCHPFTVDVDQIYAPANTCWLAGWSLGGLKALGAVLNGTWRPRGLILISSTARFCAEGDYSCGVNRAALRSMMIGLKRQREKTLRSFYSDAMYPAPADDANINLRRSDSMSLTDEELSEGLQQLDQLDFRAQLDQITLPVLVLHGERDHIIPAAASDYIHGRIKNSRQATLVDAGHELPLTHADWTTEQIKSFIHENTAE